MNNEINRLGIHPMSIAPRAVKDLTRRNWQKILSLPTGQSLIVKP